MKKLFIISILVLTTISYCQIDSTKVDSTNYKSLIEDYTKLGNQLNQQVTIVNNIKAQMFDLRNKIDYEAYLLEQKKVKSDKNKKATK